MTREEAIKILKAIRVYECYPKSAGEETKEALDMAIEALKEQEISNELQEYAYECGYEHFFHECQNCEHRRIGNKADVGEVVRCKDCVNCLHYDDETENGWLWCTINTRPTAQEDFCSFGERKGGEDE